MIEREVDGLPADKSTALLKPAKTPTTPAEHLRSLHMPEKPLFVVEPRSPRHIVNFRELWAYRELFYFLVWRDVKVRYKQTVLGATWAIIQPLFTMLIFTLIFSKVARIDSNGIPYPGFAYAALLPWMFFANAITTSGNSVINNAHLVTKVYFPRLIVPVAAVCAGLVDFAVAFPMLLALMFYYQTEITLNLLLLPLLVLLTTILAIAVGAWLSSLNVKYRDVKFAIPFLVQIWMYLSPIAYPSSVVPADWRLLYSLNPFVGIIDGYRSAIFGRAFDWKTMAVSLVVTLILLVYALRQFRKMESNFADII
jgi:lipopolysaccharide transport system permease protein